MSSSTLTPINNTFMILEPIFPLILSCFLITFVDKGHLDFLFDYLLLMHWTINEEIDALLKTLPRHPVAKVPNCIIYFKFFWD